MSLTRLRHRAGPAAGVLVALVIAAASCGGDSDEGDPAGDSAGAGTEGAAIYAESCAACHGDDLRGTSQGPSHLSIVYEPGHHSDDAFRSAIANGSPQHHWDFGDMPPVDGLDDEQVDAVIAYVREVQEREGFEAYPPE
jgi:mono/diheme cytochrome c family protein